MISSNFKFFPSIGLSYLCLTVIISVAFCNVDPSTIKMGIYRFELCGGRSSCTDEAEYMGFNNRTCDAGVPPKAAVYGNTVGPLLRTYSDSRFWKRWNVSVQTADASSATVQIRNWYPRETAKIRCRDHYVSDYYQYHKKDGCKDSEWAERVHLHKEPRDWSLVPVEGTDCFNIIDNHKPEDCWRYLSASPSCKQRYLHLAANDDGTGLQRWRMVPDASFPPDPVPVPPSPKAGVPSPKSISSPTPGGPNPAPPKTGVPSPKAAIPPSSKGPNPAPTPKATAPSPKSANPSPQPVSQVPLLLSVGASTSRSGSVAFQPSPGAAACSIGIMSNNATVSNTTISVLSFPQTVYYPSNLTPNTDYTVHVQCVVPGSVQASVKKVLHTPPSDAHPGIANFLPTSTTSGIMTVVPPGDGCNATSYTAMVAPSGGSGSNITANSNGSFNIASLRPGVTYQINVVAACVDGSLSKPSEPVFLTTPKTVPPAPKTNSPPPLAIPPSPPPPPPPSPPPPSPLIPSPSPLLPTISPSPSIPIVSPSIPTASPPQSLPTVSPSPPPPTVSPPPPPTVSPSPSPSLPKLSPPPRPSPPPPPTACTAPTSTLIVTGLYGLLNFAVTPPANTASVSISIQCQVGSNAPQNGNYTVPASQPITSVQAPGIVPDASCVAVVTAKINSGATCPPETLNFTTPPSSLFTPGVTHFQPTSINGLTFDVVPPTSGPPIVSYIVTAVPISPAGGKNLTATLPAPSVSGTLVGFEINTKYNITVVGQYSGGDSTPVGTVPLAIFPCNSIPGCTWDNTFCDKGPSSYCKLCSVANFNPTPASDGTCQCNSGYQLQSSSCSPCPSIKGCATYSSTCGCTSCSGGYALNGTTCSSTASPSPSPSPSPKAPAVIKPPTGGFSVGCFFSEVPALGCVKYEACPGGGRRCTQCTSDATKHIASTIPNSKGQCVCAANYANLDGNASNGCEAKYDPVPLTKTPVPAIQASTFANTTLPNRNVPPVFFSGCQYRSGCPGNYSQEKPDMRTCSNPTGGWAPFALKPGTYAIDKTKNDIHSIIVPKGYKVILYAGGELSNGNVVNGPNNPTASYEITCDGTAKSCLDVHDVKRTVLNNDGYPVTMTFPIGGYVDFVKVEYDETKNCPPTFTRKCKVCDPANPDPSTCEYAYVEQDCNFPNHYCMNVVTNFISGTRQIERSCVNFDRCYSEWWQGSSDEELCQRYNPDQSLTTNFQCSFCCVEDNCNDSILPPRPTLYQDN